MQRRHLYILSVCATVCLFGLEVKSARIFNSHTDKIPSPAEMSQIADSLSPEEISQLEIDDVLRDRLRFDPQWQEIAQAIRQDIIQTKWGRDPVKNPAWKRYGAKAYPLLRYYARFGDRTRRQYGIEGILNLGNPYTTIWFYQQIKQKITRVDSSYEEYRDKEKKESIALSEWEKFDQLQDPTESQLNEAISFYQKQSIHVRDRILVERLGKIKAGEITPFGLAFFRALANDPSTDEEKAKDRIWAIAELDRHGDEQGSELLQDILENDLPQLYPLSLLAGYLNYSARHWHAYYLMLGIVEKYPQSKFVRGCREYGDLTGRSYFNGEPRNQTILERNAKMTDRERLEAWQDWLNRYEDHSGADDASYFLALSLQDNNDIMGAMRLWMKMMAQPMGDGDASYLAFPHIRILLNVGLSIEQMQILLQDPDNQPLAPFLQYAIAIQYARSQNYAKALETAEDIKLETLPDRILDAYFYPQERGRMHTSLYDPVARYKKETKSLLSEQKLRWQKLLQWQIENTPESRYQIASNWAGIGGWKNGRLNLPVLHDYQRYTLPNPSYQGYQGCRKWWVCDESKRDYEEIRTKYQEHSENAIAISIYQELLEDNRTSPAIREKTLYMMAMTLFDQWENHTFSESQNIHPPAGVTATVSFNQFKSSLKRILYELPAAIGKRYSFGEELKGGNVVSDYQHRIDQIITELQTKFPQSRYTDDLLFSSFFLSHQLSYLQTLLERYPNSDRAAEAKFLLGLKK
ncbi:hypothetical protein [Pseudanabaena sp. UWO310]|uniref:hypothetical protein n=1 Tax=Pseudanabaena sp. UWO310 TaxID=2480795 RepID=UPI0011574261|nr:hypothetical protein [Pseudanabaena sp. UWO310]TYQ25515.1 hypothetical protein PseudUWO310_18970 [Pseudanabaena sp. UWO310]